MIRVGQVSTAFGVDGAVKVVPLTDFSDRFDEGATLLLDGIDPDRAAPAGLIDRTYQDIAHEIAATQNPR